MIDIKDIDLNNPTFVCPWSPIAEWKRALIVRLAKHFSLRILVETGTGWGDTVETVRTYFDDVWSIELSPTFFNSARQRFEHTENVHLVFGSSNEKLPTVISKTTGPLLFWLDAHVTGGESASNGDQTASELQSIAALRPSSLVLMDDVQPGRDGYIGPDAPVIVPSGWQTHFMHGVLILHTGGYEIPERFWCG